MKRKKDKPGEKGEDKVNLTKCKGERRDSPI